MIVPVILSGGSGTRLWPLSREDAPKQLLPLLGKNSLLQDTVLRLDDLGPDVLDPVIVCNEAHGAAILEQLEKIGRQPSMLIYEPEGRNTAPAVAVAALLHEQNNSDEDSVLLVLPADHSISDHTNFAAATRAALEAAGRGSLVTFGIVPDRPDTGFGYIKRGAPAGESYAVDRFVEKPDLANAESYVSDGGYLWNSGMFMFSTSSYLSELERYATDMLSSCREAVSQARQDDKAVTLGRDAFLSSPSDSIDYAVMEHTSKAAVVPLDAGWSDVGSWASLYDASPKQEDDNSEIGDTLTIDCQRSYIRAGDRLVVGIGLEDMVVVDTPDAILIAPMSRTQDVKEAVEQLRAAGHSVTRSSTPADNISGDDSPSE